MLSLDPPKKELKLFGPGPKNEPDPDPGTRHIPTKFMMKSLNYDDIKSENWQ